MSGLPERYKGIMPPQRARELIGKSVLLIGAPGVGKTYIAAGLYNAFKSDFKAWFDAGEYVLELIRRERLNTTDAQHLLKEWWDLALNAELIVIDDLGMEENTEKASSIFRRIIQHRYNYKKPTVITTNLNGEQLSKRYSHRVISRIYEDFKVIIMEGEDKRKRMMQEVEKWQ